MRCHTTQSILRVTALVALGNGAGMAAPTAPDQAAPKLEFEVASVKPSGPTQRGSGKILGGPGTGEATRITGDSVTLARLIYTAYDVPFDQISGPSWLQEERYDIAVKLPPGTTKQQVKAMWQSLLSERFGLVLHREARDFPVYQLTVAKGGAKLKSTAYPDARPAKPGDYPDPPVFDADGYAVIPAGLSGMLTTPRNGRLTFQSVPVARLLGLIQAVLGSVTGSSTWAPARVEDQTGLTGKYDFKFALRGTVGIGGALEPEHSPVAATGPEGLGNVQDQGGSPDIFAAVKQLSLNLTKGKAALDVVVIDHIDRVPIGN